MSSCTGSIEMRTWKPIQTPEAKKDADPAARQTGDSRFKPATLSHDSASVYVHSFFYFQAMSTRCVSLTKKNGKLLEDLVFAAHEDLVFPSKSHKVSYPCVARTSTQLWCYGIKYGPAVTANALEFCMSNSY
ncbi:hypothetical protein QQ045_022824 [Rhodiola kirilowii]